MLTSRDMSETPPKDRGNLHYSRSRSSPKDDRRRDTYSYPFDSRYGRRQTDDQYVGYPSGGAPYGYNVPSAYRYPHGGASPAPHGGASPASPAYGYPHGGASPASPAYGYPHGGAFPASPAYGYLMVVHPSLPRLWLPSWLTRDHTMTEFLLNTPTGIQAYMVKIIML